jgi:hypothetical protein
MQVPRNLLEGGGGGVLSISHAPIYWFDKGDAFMVANTTCFNYCQK